LITRSMRATSVLRSATSSVSRSGSSRALVILMAIEAMASRPGGRSARPAPRFPARARHGRALVSSDPAADLVDLRWRARRPVRRWGRRPLTVLKPHHSILQDC
jgi:hypothetical protein